MEPDAPSPYRDPSPPLLRTYRLRLRGQHAAALAVTAIGLLVTLVAIRYGVVVLPCIAIWVPGLFYALTSGVRRIRVYASHVEVARTLRPPLELPMRELELRRWPYGVELAAGPHHIKLVPEGFPSKEEFDDFVNLLSEQLAGR